MLRFTSLSHPKFLLLLFVFLCGSTLYSQDTVTYKDIFVRVYNQEGEKIAKGKLLSVTDSTLHLTLNGESKTIPVENIATIKTKRSEGNNVANGALIGGGIFALVGAASGGNYVGGDALAVGGGLVGAAGGSIVGLITTAFKNSKTYLIHGDPENLKLFAKDYIKT